MPKLAGTIIEATAARYMGKDNAAKNITRNILTEALSESNINQILSNKICKLIH